jgi:hypothetical protein
MSSVTSIYHRDDLLLTIKVTCDAPSDHIYSASTASLGGHVHADRVITISAKFHRSTRSVLLSMSAAIGRYATLLQDVFEESLKTFNTLHPNAKLPADLHFRA